MYRHQNLAGNLREKGSNREESEHTRRPEQQHSRERR